MRLIVFTLAVAMACCIAGPAFAQLHLEAEDYKAGGEGVGYHDDDPTNNGGAYRPDEGVDIEPTTDPDDNGMNVGWINAGEWMNLAADPGTWTADPTFDTTSRYLVTARIARDPADTSTMHMEVGGVDVTGPMVVPNTGGWQVWQSITAISSTIPSGDHEVRFVADDGGFNLNWVDFTAIPEPGTIALAMAGFFGLSLFGRRRR